MSNASASDTQPTAAGGAGTGGESFVLYENGVANPAAAPVATTDNHSNSASASSSPTNAETAATTAAVVPTPVAAMLVTDRLVGVPAGLKIVVNFRATGSAPILKKNKFQLNASSRFIVLIDFLRKHLHSKTSDSLYLFLNAAFSPTPDALIYDLWRQFNINNELVIHYAMQDAYG